jgi:hypothetical protein
MRVVGSQISGQDLINEGVSLGSNLGRQNKNERLLRSNRAGRRGGAMAERGDSAISSVVRVLRPWCTALAGISSKWRGAHGGSHLGQRPSWEVAVVAHDGGATSTGSVDDGG